MFTAAFWHAWEAMHHLHTAILLVGAFALSLWAFRLEEYALIGAIIVLFFAVWLVVGLFEHACQMHRDDRKAVADGKEEAKRAKQDSAAEVLKAAEAYEKERRESAERREAERREVAEQAEAQRIRITDLEATVRRLQEELADPKKQEHIADLRGFIQRGSAFGKWNMEGNDSQLYRHMCDGLLNWNMEVERTLQHEIPGELESYLYPFDLPDPRNRTGVSMFLTRQLKVLEAILGRLQR